MMPPNFLQIHFRVETFYPHHTFMKGGKTLFYLSALGIWCSLFKSQEPQPLEIQPELRVKISELFFHNHHKKSWCRKCIFADFILFSESDARGLWSRCMFLVFLRKRLEKNIFQHFKRKDYRRIVLWRYLDEISWREVRVRSFYSIFHWTSLQLCSSR